MPAVCTNPVPFHRILLSQSNCFLLRATDGFLLIDCGSAGEERRLLRKLSRLGVSSRSIRYLLLTHHHSDHCGLLPFLLSVNPDIRVIMSDTCAAALRSGRHLHPPGERYASDSLRTAFRLYGLLGGEIADTFPPYFYREADILWLEEDGALPGFVGIPGRLLHTPGHTAGSLSLIVGKHAFVGDAARNCLRFLGAPHEPILYSDRSACLKSWAKLSSSGAVTIHPGHGPSFSTGDLTLSGDGRGKKAGIE